MLTTTDLATAAAQDVGALREAARRQDVMSGARPRLRMFYIRRCPDNIIANGRAFYHGDLVESAWDASERCAHAMTEEVPPGDPETIVNRDRAMLALLTALEGGAEAELN